MASHINIYIIHTYVAKTEAQYLHSLITMWGQDMVGNDMVNIYFLTNDRN